LRLSIVLLLLGAGLGGAEDRLAVLEFFGRPRGAFCSAAGPAMTTLQGEMAGRAVLLEYDYDAFPSGRQDRFWASGASASYLPLVMVGSGFRTSSGSVDYEPTYRWMIDQELERPPLAAISAFWHRNGSSMRAYCEVQNIGDSDLEIDQEASIWLIAYENTAIGVSMTWVRSTARRYLPFDLAPGESTTIAIDSPPMSGVNWDRMAALVMIEDRPSPASAYDMLQAAEALPAGLAAAPSTLELDHRGREAEVSLTGPHVLSWSATSDVSWLEVTPNSGQVPATVTVALRPHLQPPLETEGVVTISATGDGMSFVATVVVTASGPGHRRGARRQAPSRSP
jgi:hypothetical protein